MIFHESKISPAAVVGTTSDSIISPSFRAGSPDSAAAPHSIRETVRLPVEDTIWMEHPAAESVVTRSDGNSGCLA